jgi:hypothetical protein
MLLPVGPEHLPILRNAELSPRLAYRWRHGGTHPNPADFADAFFSSALCSFLVLDNSTPDEVLGIVVGYDADFRNGHAKVGAARFTDGTAHSLQFVRGGIPLLRVLVSRVSLSETLPRGSGVQSGAVC